jgi:hypothetical protein
MISMVTASWVNVTTSASTSCRSRSPMGDDLDVVDSSPLLLLERA